MRPSQAKHCNFLHCHSRVGGNLSNHKYSRALQQEISACAGMTLLGAGFTLVELSIVLVIIGLIIGGVMVGRNLINATAIRSQISQIEQYNTAANTFKIKYDYLPGDIPEPHASGLGLIARGAIAGSGDGNGLIEGNNGAANTNGPRQLYGETALFWADLSKTGLIEGSYTAAKAVEVFHPPVTASSSPALRDYFPEAKVGGNNYIYVWSGGLAIGVNSVVKGDGKNYFGIAKVTSTTNWFDARQGLTVAQANAIDTKIDDGLVQQGKVLGIYFVSQPIWVAPGSYPWANTGSSTTCGDNNGVNHVPFRYSMGIDGGANINCALVLQFQ